jgi:hypothetical protein
MKLHSKKITLLALCALSLSTAAPIIYAGDEQQAKGQPVAATKLTDEQKNKLNTAVQAIGVVVLVAVFGAAVYAVSKAVQNK